MNADGWTFTISDNGRVVRCMRYDVHIATLPWETLRAFVIKNAKMIWTEVPGDRLENYMRADEQAGAKKP